MEIIYRCDDCYSDFNSKGSILDCYECGEEICDDCKNEGKDGYYYCNGCLDNANELWEVENEENDNEGKSEVSVDE